MYTITNLNTGEVVARDLPDVSAVDDWWKRNGERFSGVHVTPDNVIVVERTPFISRITHEISALIGLTISERKAQRAIEYVESHPEEFNEQTGMSTREAADLAIDLV